MSAPQQTIGGRVYAFGQLPATKALRVEVAIGSVIGEALFKIITGQKDDQQGAVAAAVGMMATKMDADTLIATMNLVFESVSIDGQRISSIDASFQGRNKELWQAFIAALRANFADFFPASLIDSVKQSMPAA